MRAERNFLRVAGFDELQSPKRPMRPTWIKAYVRDLDDPAYMELSIAVRGFLADFQKLAATMRNRVPHDAKFIASKLAIRPQVVGVSLSTLIRLGFVSEFVEDLKTSQNNDLYQKTDSRPIPYSLSSSNSQSTGGSTTKGTTAIRAVGEHSPECPRCDGEGCAWCRQKEFAA